MVLRINKLLVRRVGLILLVSLNMYVQIVNYGFSEQGVVTFIRPVEPSMTGIKIESIDQEAI